MPAPRKIALTDTDILRRLENGESQADIAAAAGVRREAIRQRLRTIRENLPAPAARRADETVSLTLSALEELKRNYATLAAVRDACLKLLAGDDGKMFLGPHDYDLEVMISLGGGAPHRVPLLQLLEQHGIEGLVALESKAQDPRQLLLATLSQIRQHIELGVKLTERIHDAERIDGFIRDVLREIETVDESAAARITAKLIARNQLRLALMAPGARQPEPERQDQRAEDEPP